MTDVARISAIPARPGTWVVLPTYDEVENLGPISAAGNTVITLPDGSSAVGAQIEVTPVGGGSGLQVAELLGSRDGHSRTVAQSRVRMVTRRRTNTPRSVNSE